MEYGNLPASGQVNFTNNGETLGGRQDWAKRMNEQKTRHRLLKLSAPSATEFFFAVASPFQYFCILIASEKANVRLELFTKYNVHLWARRFCAKINEKRRRVRWLILTDGQPRIQVKKPWLQIGKILLMTSSISPDVLTADDSAVGSLRYLQELLTSQAETIGQVLHSDTSNNNWPSSQHTTLAQ